MTIKTLIFAGIVNCILLHLCKTYTNSELIGVVSQDMAIPEDMVFIKEGSTFAYFGGTPQKFDVSSFFIGIHEETNHQYKTYLSYLKKYLPDSYDNAVPDLSDSAVNNYFMDPAYEYCPVVCVSKRQAEEYCSWKTDRLTEQILLNQGKLIENVIPQVQPFITRLYLAGVYDSVLLANKLPSGEEYDPVFLPNYRIPTAVEWLFVSLPLDKRHDYLINSKMTTPEIYKRDIINYMAQYKKKKRIANWDDRYNEGFFFPTKGETSLSKANSVLKLQPIMSAGLNEYGIFDLWTNAHEWVSNESTCDTLSGNEGPQNNYFNGENTNNYNFYATGMTNMQDFRFTNIKIFGKSKAVGFRCAMSKSRVGEAY